MSIDALFKRTVYYLKDAFHGGTIRKMLLSSKRVFKNQEYFLNWQKDQTNAILKWATEKCEFYKEYSGKSLSEFPVMNKLTLLENFESHKVDVSEIPWQEGKLVYQGTSGSTGIKLIIPMDTRKRNRRVADLKYFNETVGFKSHEKLGQCRMWTKWQHKNKKQIFWENIIPINISQLDENGMEGLVDTIKENKIFALRSYGSTYGFLINYIKGHPDKVGSLKTLKVCISISEALDPVVQKDFKDILGISIVECYSDEEAGVLAHQQKNDTNFYLNYASYHFEWLKLDRDEPAEFGELARIVITDFYNYSFPMIRYDTGDTAIFESGNEKSNGHPYISKLYGRVQDLIYDTKGAVIHPIGLGRIIKNFDSVKQWQFIQKDEKVYCLKLSLKNDNQVGEIKEKLLEVVGKDATIMIEKVETIPVLASGKRKPVVCEWRKNAK